MNRTTEMPYPAEIQKRTPSCGVPENLICDQLSRLESLVEKSIQARLRDKVFWWGADYSITMLFRLASGAFGKLTSRTPSTKVPLLFSMSKL